MDIFDKMYNSKLKRIAEKVKKKQLDFKNYTQEDYQRKTQELKAKVKAGAKLDDVMIEAYALVSSAGCKVMKFENYYDSQLMGGIALNDGNVTELATGEGKTLMSTLPAFLNALTGEPVHIITANEYLAKRDSEWMGQIFNYLGLSVGFIHSGQGQESKREAYNCDITYGTSSEFGFDYLRDNMVTNMKNKVCRGYGYALIDEVDSVLIDDAKTPLIISEKEQFDIQNYKDAARFVDTYITPNDVDIDLNTNAVSFNKHGIDKIEAIYGVENLFDSTDENLELLYCLNNAIKAKFMMKRDKDYVVSDNKIVLIDTQKGRPMPTHRFANGLHSAIEAKENLINPDVAVNGEQKTRTTTTYQRFFGHYKSIAGMSGTVLTSKEEFRSIYGLNVVKIESHKTPQRVDEDDIYAITKEEKFDMICEDIKRAHEKKQPVLIGTATIYDSKEISRRLDEMGIPHQLLNAKNQSREASIIAQAGRLGAVTIATNMAGRGTDIKLGGNPEWLAKQDLITEYNIDESEASKVVYDIENNPDSIEVPGLVEFYNFRLKYHTAHTKNEKLLVKQVGGLRVIGAERQESRRVDDQLKGRSGRQGDPGSSVFYVSMDDDIIVNSLNESKRATLYSMIDYGLDRKKFSKLVDIIQLENEGNGCATRKNTFNYSGVFDMQMQHFHQERDKILSIVDMKETMLDLVYTTLNDVLSRFNSGDISKEDCKEQIATYLLSENAKFFTDNLQNMSLTEIRDKIMDRVSKLFDKSAEYNKAIGSRDLNQVLRESVLGVMDRNWAYHIEGMEEIKKFIGFESQPVFAYSQRGKEMFDAMMEGDKLESIQEVLKTCKKQARTYDNVFGAFGAKRGEPKPLFAPTRS